MQSVLVSVVVAAGVVKVDRLFDLVSRIFVLGIHVKLFQISVPFLLKCYEGLD
jgi:hypothetical protein